MVLFRRRAEVFNMEIIAFEIGTRITICNRKTKQLSSFCGIAIYVVDDDTQSRHCVTPCLHESSAFALLCGSS
jgi:hypothetical protein